MGRGRISLVSKATGVSRPAIRVERQELHDLEGGQELLPVQRQGVRKRGGGRKRTVDKDPVLRKDLNVLADPITVSEQII